MSRTIEIPILKHIGNDEKLGEGFTAKAFRNAISGQDFDSVLISLKSPGGSCAEGELIADELRDLKTQGKQIIFDAIGEVASVAATLMVEGTRVIAEPTAKFMIHKALVNGHTISGNYDDIKAQLEDVLTLIDKADQKIIANYKQKRKLKNEKALFDDFYQKEKWMSAQQALEFNLIDEIKAPISNFCILSVPDNDWIQELDSETDQILKNANNG